LLDRCVAYAKAHKHPKLTDCTADVVLNILARRRDPGQWRRS
jgi:hypothetical protein